MDLAEFQRLVFSGIKQELAAGDGHHKSYEGAIDVYLPNYFEPEKGVTVTLHCYVMGPSRHYEWNASSLAEALDKAAHDVRRWIAETAEWLAEDS